MTSDSLEEFQSQVEGLVTEVLAAESQTLRALGLDPEVESDRTDSSVEMRIWFYRLGEVVDVLEFHSILGNKPTDSVGEIRVWLRESIGDVLDRARALR